jgi:membrane protease YdiL (CAAX protease family)
MVATAPEAVEAAQQEHMGGAPLSRALALGTAISVGAAPAVPGRMFTVLAIVVLAAGGAAGMRRSPRTAALAVAAATLLATRFFPSISHLAPVPVLLALGALILASRFHVPWLTAGEFGRAVAGWIIAIVVVSGIGLIAWWRFARPDVSDLTLTSELRHAVVHPAVLVMALVGWSALNAAAEELFFRGALQHALTWTLGSPLGIGVQAAAFGFFHYRGFPRGWSGVALAAIYGLLLGALRRRARGLLAPWVAHVAADLVIACILFSIAR